MIEKLKLANDIAKTILSSALIIVVIYLVQLPGTILNTRKTAEDTMRERARLMIDIIKIEDESQREEALAVLKFAYGNVEIDEFDELEELLSLRKDINIISREASGIDASRESSVAQCISLTARLTSLQEQIQELEHRKAAEERGIGATAKVGRGANWARINELQQSIEMAAEKVRRELSEICGS